MSNYVNKVTFECNGQVIDDFKTVKEGRRTITRPVNLMHKTGKTKATQRPTVSLDYVVPEDAPEFDFEAIGDDAVITLEYENGKRITYRGCSVGEIGEAVYDEEKELVKTIDFIAEDRVEE
jgi:hypothetical protein